MRRFKHDDKEYVYLDTEEQANELITDVMIEETLGWFEDEKGVPGEEFIDRLCDNEGPPHYDTEKHRYGLGFDMDSYDNDAARSILRRARRIKKEQNS